MTSMGDIDRWSNRTWSSNRGGYMVPGVETKESDALWAGECSNLIIGLDMAMVVWCMGVYGYWICVGWRWGRGNWSWGSY